MGTTRLVDEIRSEWDWDKLVRALPPAIMYSIERDVAGNIRSS